MIQSKVLRKQIAAILILALIALLAIEPLTSSFAGSKNKRKKTPLPYKAISSAIGRYADNEVLVRFKKPATGKKQRAIFKKSGIQKVLLNIETGPQDVKLVKTKKGFSVSKSLRKLHSEKLVSSVEPNSLGELMFTPNDTNFGNQWGLHNTGQTIGGTVGTADADIDAVEAWDLERGNANTVVAVIDSGIDTAHSDLSANLWQNDGEIANNDRDDDGNGYTDDVNGFNFVGITQVARNYAWAIGYERNDYVAQSIKGTGEPLNAIGLRFTKVGNPTNDITVSIRSSRGGRNLASYTIDSDEVTSEPDYIEIYKALNRSVTLTNNQTYYIVARTSGGSHSNFYRVSLNSNLGTNYVNDPYKEGAFSRHDGTDLNDYANDDMFFRTNGNANPHDDNGHGTHVAGIVAAAGNNNQGVSGVAPGARIMPIKVSPSNGKGIRESDLLMGIAYAAANDADVINMSLGGFDQSAIAELIIELARLTGITVIAAAGNDGDGTIRYPASYQNVISVAATTNTDTRASFSNFNAEVDVSAPGNRIYSTTPSYATAGGRLSLNYDYMSGTSMATPMVSGLAALVLSRNQNYSPDQVRQAIELFADDLGDAGRDDSFGKGRINANRSVQGDTTAPSTPTISSPSHPISTNYYQNNNPSFIWTATDDSGIKDYSYILDGSISTIPDNRAEGSTASKSYSAIANGKQYFHVKARDIFDNWSPTATYEINIDNSQPRTSAPYSARGRLKQNIDLYYRVSDSYTGDQAYVTIVIKKPFKHFTWQIVQTIPLGLVTINRLSYYTYRATQPVGSYRFYIQATDRAGNSQYSSAYNSLTIN